MLRRKFISSGIALVAGLPLVQHGGFGMFNTDYFNEEVMKIKIGTLDCLIFRDMMFNYLAKDFFINVAREELKQSLDQYHVGDGNIPSPFIAVMLRAGNKKILIDTGIGYSDRPVNVRGNAVYFKGRLHQLMQQENIKQEDITDVVITHFHPDHIGGIFSDDGQLNFPNAKFHMHKEEWDYWHSSRSVNQPEQFRYFIEKNITGLKDGNLHLIDGDFIELSPGLTVVKTDGHTPGQIALIIHSAREQLLYISDAFLHPLHVERIDWQTNYDMDHDKAKQSRLKLIDLAYKNDMLVNAFHFDFPGLGRIDKYQNNWKWQYTTAK